MKNRRLPITKWLTLISAVLSTTVVVALMIFHTEQLKTGYLLLLFAWLIFNWLNFLARCRE